MMLHSCSGDTMPCHSGDCELSHSSKFIHPGPECPKATLVAQSTASLRPRSSSILGQCFFEANRARAPASSIIRATASSAMETFSGTATAPKRRMPKSSTAISKLLSMSTATRSPGFRPSTSRPLAARAVSLSNDAQERRRSPSTKAVRAPRHLPCNATKWGSVTAGAWNHVIGGTGSLEVILGRHLIGARRSIETDLADASDEGIGGSDGRVAAIVAGDPVIPFGEIFYVQREAPSLVGGGEGG